MSLAILPAWKPAPFFRLLPPFILGILIQHFFSISIVVLWILLFISGAWVFLQHFISVKHRFRFGKISGVAILLAVTCTSALVTSLSRPSSSKNFFLKYGAAEGSIVRLSDDPVKQGERFRVIGEVQGVVKGKQIISATGNTFIYLSVPIDKLPRYGDVLLIRGKSYPLSGMLNPGGFDFASYASRKGIYHAWYTDQNGFCVLYNQKNFFQSFLNDSRNGILKILQKHLKDIHVLGVAEAILIGYRGHLDKEILQSYTNTGVVHVIAISGLHLGLVYVVLKWIINALIIFRRKPKLKWPVMLICLWWFALVTGASASVLRSATMFSFLLTGETFFKSTGSKNVLTSSAFVLLAVQPYLLWDVGFMLSYGAVAGLIWWQRPISSLVYFKKKAFQKLWNATSVTLAAQLAVTPLCIYYFHQFPTWFLIANLIVVPLATVILISLLILVAISFIPFLVTPMAWLVQMFICLMNGVISNFEHWPVPVITEIFSNEICALLQYAFLLTVVSGVLFKNKRFIWLGLGCLLLLSGYVAFKKLDSRNRKDITVYHTKKGLSVDFFEDRNCTGLLIADSTGNNGYRAESPWRTQRLIKNIKEISIIGKVNCITFQKKHMVIIGPDIQQLKLQPHKAHYVVLYGSPRLTIQQITAVFNPDTIILAVDNKRWKIEQWKSECEDLHLRCVSIKDSGALVFY